MLDLHHLSSLLSYVTDPKGPDFYRRHFTLAAGDPALALESWAHWHALPLLTKDDLLATPLKERSFIPLAKVERIRASSGTAGKPPLFSPRTKVQGVDYYLQFHDFTKGILTYIALAPPNWYEELQSARGIAPRVVVYDPTEPLLSVRLAQKADVDSIIAFVHHLPVIGKEMERQGLAQHIRFIEVAGERLSPQMIHYVHKTFPHATLVSQYGMSEIEDAPVGTPCTKLDEDTTLLYHPKKTHYIELLDLEGVKSPAIGAEGELVLTTWSKAPAAFPMVRYRMGDSIKIAGYCTHHDAWSFSIIGRTAMDSIKLPGGILRTEEIVRVLETLGSKSPQRFELHSYENIEGGIPRTKLVLHVDEPPHTDLVALAQAVQERLRVAPEFTYFDGVIEGRYLPLSCELFNGTGKGGRIVRH
jgi:phenylacetate-coenzyme A ligase PaaK-like adenylate-forming protein